jgi:hypothetical protein
MIKKPRTVMARTAIRQRLNATAAASNASGGGASGVANWNYTTVKVAVGEAEARLRAEALERERQRDSGPPTAREQAILKAVSDALLAERRLTQNQQGVGGSGELAPTVNKLEQMTGLAIDALEQQLSSLQAEVAELRQALLTLNSRTPAPRTLLITHADGTTSTLTETLADEAKDDDMLKPPDRP